MKAWLVSDKDEPSYTSVVVFAETSGKAKSIAITNDLLDESDFIDLEVRRLPQVDKYYTEGKTELEWDNPKDRLILIRNCDFTCEDECDFYCKDCSGKEYCYKYLERDEKNEL